MLNSVCPFLTLVMLTIGCDNTFCRCALAGLESGDEALVVLDGLPPAAPARVLLSVAILLNPGLRQGPTAARNLATQSTL